MPPALTNAQIQQFIHEGYIRLDNAFPEELAAQGRTILWQAIPCNLNDPTTWTQPVIRLGDFSQEPFRKAANTANLHSAFDQLVGKEAWVPRMSLGSFPVRFPSNEEPNDTGWHVDASFPGADLRDYLAWRINVFSKGRALLMLFLFSDVSEKDAPTRIRVGSHLKVACLLKPAGEAGLSFMELANKLKATDGLEEVSATGPAGTVYLCHPFIVHAAQPHHGTNPRFLAQPPLVPTKDFVLQRSDNNYSPIEIAIRLGLRLD
ncbi:phytanoyl-CoA dioxygenase [Adhaeribacter arboris]|uniref:Phytanoyl-CoA dioxygenase n=1 Tax=Adhaeribacter arboris TaxID=2072846 RepID=A0A2T2YLG6_9BACT|nr:phytanoyl-CoA dioxygenase family protein [Adhaeribacter arboris]PSR56363.1 phytanoyl-CoA dioxygenase [Adhaeribacter arboris]